MEARYWACARVVDRRAQATNSAVRSAAFGRLILTLLTSQLPAETLTHREKSDTCSNGQKVSTKTLQKRFSNVQPAAYSTAKFPSSSAFVAGKDRLVAHDGTSAQRGWPGIRRHIVLPGAIRAAGSRD